MKKSVLLSIVFLCAIIRLTAQDTPNPPANLQLLPVGSYVIPMDNTLQTDNVIGAGNFNLKAYGLVVALLNGRVKVKWAIRAGKSKDGVDFSAFAEQCQPVLVSGGVSRSFKAAPFVIFAADTAGVSSIINTYYQSQGLTGNERPKMFRTTAATPNVDIRYDMTGFVPKAAILTDGGNQKIHRDYMINAGIGASNYREVAAITLSDCFTFASEPHNDESGPALNAIVASIRQFVLTGRNFLAECAAVRTYENNPFGRFHSTTGFTDANENLGTNVAFPFADLSYFQLDGSFDASNGGSLQNWTVTDAIIKPADYANATGTGVFSAVQAATVSKLTSGPGGLVFYLGNHEFKNNNPEEINGIRLYLNAFMTPTNTAASCSYGTVLSVKLVQFQCNLRNTKASLQWTVAQNESVSRFEVERSQDGINFSTAAQVPGSERTGTDNYPYSETAIAEKIYYRLKITGKDGTIIYSSIIALQNNSAADHTIRIISNPATDKLSFSYQSAGNQGITVHVLDMAGRRVMQQTISSFKGSNLASLPLPAGLNRGMYILDIVNGADHQAIKFIKN